MYKLLSPYLPVCLVILWPTKQFPSRLSGVVAPGNQKQGKQINKQSEQTQKHLYVNSRTKKQANDKKASRVLGRVLWTRTRLRFLYVEQILILMWPDILRSELKWPDVTGCIFRQYPTYELSTCKLSEIQTKEYVCVQIVSSSLHCINLWLVRHFQRSSIKLNKFYHCRSRQDSWWKVVHSFRCLQGGHP